MGSTWRTYRWLLGVFGRASWLVVALCAIQAAMAAIAVGYALMMRGAIDAAVAHDEPAFLRESLTFAVAIVIQIALRAANVMVAERARATMDNRMRAHVFAGILDAPLARTQARHSGELMNRLTSDVTVVSGAVTSLVPNAVSMAIRIVGVVAVMIVLAPLLTVVFLAGGCVMAGASFLLRGLLKRLHKRVQEAEGRVRSYMQEALESLLVIRAFGVGGKVRDLAARRMDAHRGARMRRVTVTAVASTGLASAMNLGYLVGFVWCGFGILHGTLSYGTMMAVIQLIGQIQSPFAMMGGMFPQHAAMLASAERLREVGETDAMRENGALSGAERTILAHSGVDGTLDARGLYARMDAIRFDHVDFTYGRNQVLRDFSCDVHKGDFVAITGRSGIGKSTLMKLLLGAYEPQHGDIGVAVADAVGDGSRSAGAVNAGSRSSGAADSMPQPAGALVPPSAIPRGFFAYVPQGNALMSGTIRETVAFADPDPDPAHIDDARVREACRIADAAGFVEALPDGYDTRLGEHGAGLSEGQMQRIAVARALYSGAPVLLLDESTSALDVATEHAMLERIRAMRDRTVLIVTHRAEVLDYCDAVVTLGEHMGERV
ncbi:ABC transporter ATP-binding protein [Bifidobacterium parmae]|uniref:ABC-type multidrug transport system, ATPase and permease component n=1 Tax=Bifidobacterium parmae TaxID=361854 RepID=A0A2N5J0I0_9BIFI|nr:ABC transporter ATP-binding protein [Bifidobacterium parmae]PLS27716.1 ABC-type multidrug transport system, ATPase and permease component [Bifidobacterium parmae]